VSRDARADPVKALRTPAPGGDDTDPGSPCNSTCRIAPDTGWCEGCLRSMDEIIAWGAMPPAAKRRVWAELSRRANAVTAGGRDGGAAGGEAGGLQ
jgi:predicted Fe-S protein YdhL (DUF1289 family)